MSDRKYRQRGYQDDDRDRQRPPNRTAPAARAGPSGARARRTGRRTAHLIRGRQEPANARLPRSRAVRPLRNARRFADFFRSKCTKCSQDLRSCAQCVHFDPSARFECTQTIPARVSPKDVANECVHYSARTNWERETSSAIASKPSEPSGAKKAFDDLFKF